MEVAESAPTEGHLLVGVAGDGAGRVFRPLGSGYEEMTVPIFPLLTDPPDGNYVVVDLQAGEKVK